MQNIPRQSPNLSAWHAVSNSDAARIVVTDTLDLDTSSSFTNTFAAYLPDYAAYLPGYTDKNIEAYDHLFTFIQSNYPTRSAEVLELIKDNMKAGKPLTAQIVKDVLLTAENTTSPFCAKWNSIAKQDVLSPRSDIGKKLVQEFSELISNRFASANARSNVDKLAVLNIIKNEIQKDAFASAAIKNKLNSLINLEIQRYIFAINVQKSTNCPQLSSMLNVANDGWRLVLDGKHQENGIYYFENERGYMAAMLSGLNLMLETLDDPLSADLYCALHDAAVEQVHKITLDAENLNAFPEVYLISTGYRTDTAGFNLVLGVNCTEEGLKEFEQTNDKKEWLKIHHSQTCEGMVELITLNPPNINSAKALQAACKNKVAEIIDRYHLEIDAAREIKGSTEKETAILTCIAKCCQDLDQHHFFQDGNIRTAVFLVMNKLLLQNNLCPVILKEPNAVDMHSVNQIVDLIREGQATYHSLCVRNN